VKQKIQRMAFIMAHDGGRSAAEKFIEMRPTLTGYESTMLAVEIAANLPDSDEVIFRRALWKEAKE
jgi:hypothetical protein